MKDTREYAAAHLQRAMSSALIRAPETATSLARAVRVDLVLVGACLAAQLRRVRLAIRSAVGDAESGCWLENSLYRCIAYFLSRASESKRWSIVE